MGSLRIPFVLALLLSAVAFSSDFLGPMVGPLDYRGQLTYVYSSGEYPIVHVIFNLDEDVGDALLITDVPSGWTYNQNGNILTLSGGILEPGETLRIGISFKKYIPPGERPFDSHGTTNDGSIVNAQGILVVSEMWLLKILGLLAENMIPLFVATLGLGIYELYSGMNKGVKKPKIRTSTVTYGNTPTIEGYPDLPGLSPPGILITDDTESEKPREDFVIYVVSDQHMGSHVKYDVKKRVMTKGGIKIVNNWKLDKSDSNLFDVEQAERFINWLEYIDREIKVSHPVSECHLVINGDFLDLWQAKIPSMIGNFNTSYGSVDLDLTQYANRIDSILDEHIIRYECQTLVDEDEKVINVSRKREIVGKNPNYQVIKNLLKFASQPGRTIFYLIGNHDDSLYAGSSEEDEGFKAKTSNASNLRNYLSRKLDEIGKKEGLGNLGGNFKIGRFYWNKEWSVYAEHGHTFDKDNWKEDEPSGGQNFVEKGLTKLQESGVGSFWGMASEPYSSAVAYLRCEFDTAKKSESKRSEKVGELIDEFIEESADALGYRFIENFITNNYIIEKAEEKFSPSGIYQEDSNYSEKGEAIKNATDAHVVTMGHTHRPFATKYGEDYVYINTGEWIYNIKLANQNCKLEKNRDGHDYYLKIEPWTKKYPWEGENENSLRVDLYYYPIVKPAPSEEESKHYNWPFTPEHTKTMSGRDARWEIYRWYMVRLHTIN